MYERYENRRLSKVEFLCGHSVPGPTISSPNTSIYKNSPPPLSHFLFSSPPPPPLPNSVHSFPKSKKKSCTSMDKTTERETRDFMSVESFSQLPFIRSAPRDKGAGGIRLFGQEFGSRKTSGTDDQSESTDDDNNNNNAQEGEANNGGSSSSSRKFECHYCCRNFPTSQALGGHQNAHKRERQQAKRAHLQSAMLHGSLADPHVYGLMNYNRLGSAPPLPVAYHSWSSSAGSSAYSAGSRIYGGYAAQPQPITCSPLAFWRVPAATQTSTAFAGRDRPMMLPPSAFGNKDEMRALPSPISSIPASQLRFGYESKAKMQDHVSLDLHL